VLGIFLRGKVSIVDKTWTFKYSQRNMAVPTFVNGSQFSLKSDPDPRHGSKTELRKTLPSLDFDACELDGMPPIFRRRLTTPELLDLTNLRHSGRLGFWRAAISTESSETP